MHVFARAALIAPGMLCFCFCFCFCVYPLPSQDGNTAVLRAAGRGEGDLKTLTSLLEKGANPDIAGDVSGESVTVHGVCVWCVLCV